MGRALWALCAALSAPAGAVELSGRVDVIVQMPARDESGHRHVHDGDSTRYHYRLKADDGRFLMLQGEGLSRLRTGMRVRVNGSVESAYGTAAISGPVSDEAAAVAPLSFPSMAVTSVTPAEQSALGPAALAPAAGTYVNPRTTGVKTVHIIRPLPIGEPLAPPKDVPDHPVAALYRRLSNGKLDLKVKVFEGHYTEKCKPSAIIDLPPGALDSDYSAYHMNCGMCSAIVGGDSSTCGYGLSDHELGHNFGWYHANSYGCRIDDRPVTIDADYENCKGMEYGDSYDLMGKGEEFLNAIHLNSASWLAAAEIARAERSGVYTVHAIDSPGSVRALTIRADIYGTTTYWLEYRRTGLQIRQARRDGNGDTQLLKRVFPSPDPNRVWELDPNWVPGSRFEDAFSKVFVTVLSTSATSAVVQVQLGDAPPPPADTRPPAVSVSAPVSGAVLSGTVQVAAAASDDVGVSRVELQLDGRKLADGASFSWDTRTASDGGHTLLAKAYDAAGNEGVSSPVSIIVRNAAPPPPAGAVKIHAPAAGAKTSGKVDVLAEVPGLRPTRLELYQDGKLVGTVVPEAP